MSQQASAAAKPLSDPNVKTRRLGARLRLGAVLALAVASGLVAWMVIGNDSGSTNDPGTASATGTGPIAMTAGGLRSLSRDLDRPIYWAGARRDYTYEVTQTGNGTMYVRYLPPGTEAGAAGANYLIVVTYPFKSAFAALKRVGGGREESVQGNGIALVHDGYPKSVHLAFRGLDYQLEVYHPSAQRARTIALSGDVRPVR